MNKFKVGDRVKFQSYIGTVCEKPENSDNWSNYKDFPSRTWVCVGDGHIMFPLTTILKKLSKLEQILA